MKTKFTILLLSLFTLFSCEDTIYDIFPIDIYIDVEDSEGNNLLLEENPNNILNNDIKVVYNDIEYPLGVDMSEQEDKTRAYLARLSGLKIDEDNKCLKFGEFDGAENWDETFEIFWGDGTSDKIRFTRNFKWGANGKPSFSNRNRYLNGKKVEGKLLIIK